MPVSCSVEQRCSAAGRECASTDRACQGVAVQDGLEIVCERADPDALVYLYCPPGAGSRDSGVVWLLLAVAVAIAVAGSVVAYVISRRPSPRP